MSDAARIYAQPPVAAAGPTSFWSGELHGEVAAMHRAIEQRLSAGSFDLAVIPLPVRPVEDMLARLSRAAGWITLAGAFTGAASMVVALLC
jgi:hypothetical protein